MPATTDPAHVISALIGPLYYRRWFSREPIDEQFVARLVSDVIGSRVVTDY